MRVAKSGRTRVEARACEGITALFVTFRLVAALDAHAMRTNVPCTTFDMRRRSVLRLGIRTCNR